MIHAAHSLASGGRGRAGAGLRWSSGKLDRCNGSPQAEVHIMLRQIAENSVTAEYFVTEARVVNWARSNNPLNEFRRRQTENVQNGTEIINKASGPELS